jgi:hypothetical protein
MRKYDVYFYQGDVKVGEFLNVETDSLSGDVNIWYLNSKGEIRRRFREDVYLKKVEKHVPGQIIGPG